MKTLYFDCIGGISGDMILGALLDAGLDISILKKNLAKLDLKNYAPRFTRDESADTRTKANYVINYVIRQDSVERGHVHATKFDVRFKARKRRPLSIAEITKLIKTSRLDKDTKELSLRIYNRLAEVEKYIHRTKAKDFRFAQLGDFDSLVDIVGIAAAINTLGIEKFYVSDIPLGKKSAAASLELLKGFEVHFTQIPFENVTPTGAAVLSALGARAMPRESKYKITNIGYGAGSNNPEHMSNVLRVIISEAVPVYTQDKVTIIQTNIDDMNPEGFEYLQDLLFEAGALDVYYQPVQMKKSRIGILLTVLASADKLDTISQIIFRETTTLGLRFYEVRRNKLKRQIQKVKTKFGPVRVKIGRLNGTISTIAPEYDDCKVLARKTNEPLRRIYEEAKLEGAKLWH